MNNQKHPLLERYSWIAGIVSAALAGMALLYSYLTPTQLSSPTTVSLSASGAQNQIGTVGGNVTIVNTTPTTPEVPQKKLSEFLANAMGRNLPYIESIYGPPRSVTSGQYQSRRLHYQIEKCNVVLEAEPDNQVHAFTLDLSPTCTFEWKDVLPNHSSLPPPHVSTFGQIMKTEGSYTIIADCLSNCGNAADPTVHLHIGGSRADGWLLADFEADAVDQNLKGFSALRTKIQREKGEDFVTAGRYACDFNLNAAAAGAVDSMRPNRVTIRPVVTGGEPEVGDNARCERK